MWMPKSRPQSFPRGFPHILKEVKSNLLILYRADPNQFSNSGGEMKNNLYKMMALLVIVSTLLAACGGAPAAKEPAKISVFVGFGAGSDPDSMEALKKIA